MPILNISDISSVYAQNWTYENGSYWLEELIVTNDKQIKCDCCQQSFKDKDAFDRHLKYDNVCRSYYGIDEEEEEEKEEEKEEDKKNNNEKKDDKTNNTCRYCHRPSEMCICTGISYPGTSQPTSAKSRVSKSKLVSIFKSSEYNRTYDKTRCGYCLKGWKTIWQKAGIGEYDGTRHARDFGPVLSKYGFKVICSGNGDKRPSGYTPQIGDTRVWETHPEQKTPSGHIDWWNGTNWVSDYKQIRDWIPGTKYKEYNVSFKIYR